MDRFSNEFLFGIATSSYQIEGAWNIKGKGENIWDRLVHTHPEVIKDHSTGDVSASSYFLYKEDVKIIKDIGFDFYRFSISWARILPTGESHEVNLNGIEHYNNVINELLKNGIQPMITMYHWDLPQRLQDMGGWLNPLIVDFFCDYARILFAKFGDRVKFWITINEPLEVTQGYGDSTYAPMLDFHGSGEYLAGHHLLLAHSKVYRLYQETFKTLQNGKVSIGISGKCAFPATNSKEDTEAADRHMEFSIGWFSHPIYSSEGNYPPVMRERVDNNSKNEGRRKSRLPTFTPDEITLVKGSSDFFAFQHYTSVEVTSGIEGKIPSIQRDSYVKFVKNQNWPSSNITWLKTVPEGLRKALNWINQKYNPPEIFITESGYGMEGEKSLEDDERITYFSSYLKELLKSINEDKCKVIGYTAWSLLDNFEWSAGYTAKFGLVHVDFDDINRKRTPKKSALFFKRLLMSRIIP